MMYVPGLKQCRTQNQPFLVQRDVPVYHRKAIVRFVSMSCWVSTSIPSGTGPARLLRIILYPPPTCCKLMFWLGGGCGGSMLQTLDHDLDPALVRLERLAEWQIPLPPC